MALARLALRAIARTSTSLAPDLRLAFAALQLSARLSQGQTQTLAGHQTTASTRSVCSCTALYDSQAAPSLPTSTSGRDRNMAIIFTCTKCDTRSAKTFTRQSYENGIVLVRCPGCKSLHLIADNLGWFGEEKFKIEDLASQVEVRRVDATGAATAELGSQLTAEDVAGWSRVQAIAAAAVGAAPTPVTGAEAEQDEVLQLDPADLEAWKRVREQAEEKPAS